MEENRKDEYKRPYLILFNDATDAIRAIERCDYGTARDILIKAQQKAENSYVDSYIGERKKK